MNANRGNRADIKDVERGRDAGRSHPTGNVLVAVCSI